MGVLEQPRDLQQCGHAARVIVRAWAIKDGVVVRADYYDLIRPCPAMDFSNKIAHLPYLHNIFL